jgi:hypothetical protein
VSALSQGLGAKHVPRTTVYGAYEEEYLNFHAKEVRTSKFDRRIL